MHKKENKVVKKSNKNIQQFHPSTRGFGTRKDTVIWDTGNVIQWIDARDIMIHKFKSENVFNRIVIDPEIDDEEEGIIHEVEFDKEMETEFEYVNNKIIEMNNSNDTTRIETLAEIQAMRDAHHITPAVKAKMDFDVNYDHTKRANAIETTERYKLESDYNRLESEFEKLKMKFAEDSAKVIKIFNESLGSSSRSLIREELAAGSFKLAWKKLDDY
jgi:hypothetical protein